MAKRQSQKVEPPKVIGAISQFAGALVGTVVVTGKQIVKTATQASEKAPSKPRKKSVRAPAKKKKRKKTAVKTKAKGQKAKKKVVKKRATKKKTQAPRRSKTSRKRPEQSPAKKQKRQTVIS